MCSIKLENREDYAYYNNAPEEIHKQNTDETVYDEQTENVNFRTDPSSQNPI